MLPYIFGAIVTDTTFKDCFVFFKLSLKFFNQRTPFRLQILQSQFRPLQSQILLTLSLCIPITRKIRHEAIQTSETSGIHMHYSPFFLNSRLYASNLNLATVDLFLDSFKTQSSRNALFLSFCHTPSKCLQRSQILSSIFSCQSKLV